MSELRKTIDHLRKKEEYRTRSILYPGLAGKHGSGLRKTLDTNERIIADESPFTISFDHEFNYSVLSSKASVKDLDQCVLSSELVKISEASVGE